jgi:tetratricopeptide (TPR) repeat protein
MSSDAAASYEYDVFISYSSKDKDWVRGELLPRIEKAGVRAMIDYRDFTPGVPSMRGMERALTISRKTLLVLTPAFIESGWSEMELRMGQTLDPAARDPRLIPLLKAPCEKPLSVKALTHIDFTDGADHDLAWRQLLTALEKPPQPPPVQQPSREQWFLAHPYAMPPNFTGRVAERQMLTEWLTKDAAHPLLVVRALGGFGKSALTWHWLLHDVDPAHWPRVVWWSFYEAEAGFDRFVPETLDYLSGNQVGAAATAPREQLDALLRGLRSPGTLLMLDGFERALRAFSGLEAAYQGDQAALAEGSERDCVAPLAEAFLRSVASLPGMGGKVLLTTRLRPAPVETRGGILLQGCREEDLVQLNPTDAVAFFRAQGIRGGRAEIQAACEPYGYHPLSLRLLAGWVVKDLQQPGDIAAAQRLDLTGDLVQRQHHVLEQAFSSLGLSRQKLLSHIACFRSPVNYDALVAIAESENSVDADLRDLVARGLLHHDLKASRFDLHPIVRRYAYDRLSTSDRTGAHGRLRDYFAAVPASEELHSIDDLTPVIELYHHTVRAGQYDQARKLFKERLDIPTYYQFGAYHLQIELLRSLFPDGEESPPPLQDEYDQAATFGDLALVYCLTGQPHRAVPLFERDAAIFERHAALEENVLERTELGLVLGNLARMAQTEVGLLRDAEANLRRIIDRGLTPNSTSAWRGLVLLLAYRGAWAESETVLNEVIELDKSRDALQAHGIDWTYRAQFELLRARASNGREFQSAVEAARRGLMLAEEAARRDHPVERDFIRAHWLLGASYRASGNLRDAADHLDQALARCRRINLVDIEAMILIELSRLQIDSDERKEALSLAETALIITERCGYLLQSADVHLVLARLASTDGNSKEALRHAIEAKKLATCDGPPDYTYKAAYDEAIALLAELGVQP